MEEEAKRNKPRRAKMSRRDRKSLVRIIISAVLFVAILVAGKIVRLDELVFGRFGFLLPLALYGAIFIIIGCDVVIKAFRNLFVGQLFDENLLMTIAAIGAFALAVTRAARGEAAEGFDEACAVLILYQTGELFQRLAAAKSRRSISELMDVRPDIARVIRGGEIVVVSPEEVCVGETIVVLPGEKIPLDGVIIDGESAIDASSLTGESRIIDAGAGDKALSGTVSVSGELRIRAEKEFGDSTVNKILALVESASDHKSKAENFIGKFAKVYTPAVVALAAILAIIPSLITKNPSLWIYRALSFLVVSCPCALVISVPLSFFAGIGAASRGGVLIKGSNYLEMLDRANVFVFDKTGTLTEGRFAVSGVFPESRREEILRLAATAEKNSVHPIGKSIVECYGKTPPSDYKLTSFGGKGISASRGEETILCGNAAFMRENGIAFDEKIVENLFATVVFVAKNGEYVGAVSVSDKIRQNAPETLSALRKGGARTVMLTGDNEKAACVLAKSAGITEYRAGLLPQDKVSEVEKLIAERDIHKSAVAFIGDGVNDAPVLMRADVGIAMGGIGSDAAIEAADVVLMRDDLSALLLGKRIAAKTMRIVRENVVFSIGVKLLILILSAFGIANMWFAVFGDVGVAIIAVLNALRVNGGYDKVSQRERQDKADKRDKNAKDEKKNKNEDRKIKGEI